MAKDAERFGGMISSMDIDDKYVYGSSSGSILVWEKGSLELVRRWDGLGRGVRLSVDDTRLYCTGLYHFMALDKQTGQKLHEAQFGSDISSDLGRPIHDSRYVYFPIRNGDLAVIDKGDYAARILKGHEGTVWGMDQDDERLYTGSVDKKVRIWSKADLSLLHALEGHRSNVQRVHVTGSYLVSASADLSVIFWDKATGQRLHRITGAHKRAINGLASWGDRLLTSSMAERRVRIWELGTWALKKELELALAEGASPIVEGDTVYLALRREPGVRACPAEELFL